LIGMNNIAVVTENKIGNSGYQSFAVGAGQK
jgi:hypothetical protein